MSKLSKYDNSNPYLWLFLFFFCLFWLLQWAGERPTKLKPKEKRPAATRFYRGR